MPWPASVVKQLGRAPIVGDWHMATCALDLYQVESEDDLAALAELDECLEGYSFWSDLRQALVALSGDSEQFGPECVARYNALWERVKLSGFCRETPVDGTDPLIAHYEKN